MGRVLLVAHCPGFQNALAGVIQTQSQHQLQLVGAMAWDADIAGAISSLQPEVVVLVLGLEVCTELQLLSQIRPHIPGCRFLVIDTLGEVRAWQAESWDLGDALLCLEQLQVELVPTLCQLVAQGAGTTAVR
ncbi:MAG: hypothetical protein HGA45_09700 [Chloroflexales bacterium]|nr:hypothetical protein [Chloroflexales bacterium]